MPELPEVETIRTDLEKFFTGAKINAFRVFDLKLLRDKFVLSEIKPLIEKQQIKKINRIGKYLQFHLVNQVVLWWHLGMTGKFKISQVFEDIKHLRAYLDTDRGFLLYADARRFGKIMVQQDECVKILGIDPLSCSYTYDKFTVLFNSKKSIKSFLLDQNRLSGIGNIYADEILWEAKISPIRSANSLTDEELKGLFKIIPLVLREAIKHRGTSISDYLDAHYQQGNYSYKLKVYSREGKACPKCHGLIKRIIIGGRSTCFCSACQK